MDIADLSMRYCARQDAHPLLVLWALLALLIVAFPFVRKRGAFASAAVISFIVMTAAVGVSIFSGCSMTAPSEQGLGSSLSGDTYRLLRCLHSEALALAVDWSFFTLSCFAAIASLRAALATPHVPRIRSIALATVSIVAAMVAVLVVVFDFSWCTSERLF